MAALPTVSSQDRSLKLTAVTKAMTNCCLLVLKPLNLSAKAILNMKPSQDSFSAPMLDIKIVLESILFELDRLQVS